MPQQVGGQWAGDREGAGRGSKCPSARVWLEWPVSRSEESSQIRSSKRLQAESQGVSPRRPPLAHVRCTKGNRGLSTPRAKGAESLLWLPVGIPSY